MTREPEVLYEDTDILICYKPAGMAVQTRRLGQPDMETWLKNYRVRRKEAPYIGIIHRLDQPVEGLVLFAKNQKAAARLSRQIQGHELGKYYYAIGSAATEQAALPPQSATLTDYLGFDAGKNLGYIASAEAASGDRSVKKAVLDYRILGQEGAECCFAITLHTGRHHQIRLQLANLGYPLLGDPKYGGAEGQQIALCARRLEFEHPTTKKRMTWEIRPRNPLFDKYL